MQKKHYLTAILFFGIILLSGFSAKSQEISDTIRMVRKISNYLYYQNNDMISFNKVLQLTRSNPEAIKLMEKSNNMRTASYIFGGVGGFCLGFSLGYLIISEINKLGVERKISIVLGGAGVGIGLIAISIGFEAGASKKAREGVAIYNNSIKQKNSTNIDLGFSTNGMMFRLNF